MNTVIRKHEELLEVYERLGMLDMLEKERAQYVRVCAYYGYNPKCNQPKPVQLSLF